MGRAAHAFDEPGRLARLHGLNLLDTAADPRFDSLAVRALALFPTALRAGVSLVDADRVWFKSITGSAETEFSRDVAFCAHAVLGHCAMVVSDLRLDRRFADNVLVAGDPGLRFYVGVPLAGGVGALCVFGKVPHRPTPAQMAGLLSLALLADTQVLMHGALQTLRHVTHPSLRPA